MDPERVVDRGPESTAAARTKGAERSAEVGIEAPIAVGKKQDALDVDLGLPDRQPFEKAIELRLRSGGSPEARDPPGAAVVAGERELDPPVEHAEHLAEVGGTELQAVARVVEARERERKLQPARQLAPGRGHQLHEAARP